MHRILFLLIIVLTVSCSKNDSPSFTIQGHINKPENNYVILHQETDIERKISTLIDTLKIDKNGNFKADFYREPHYYSLALNDNEKISLAINKGQKVNIEVNDTETLVTGSKDTDLLTEYESLRKSSLERLVNSIRKQIVLENTAENPNPKTIDSLGKLELSNYDLHLDELNAFIQNKMANSIAIYPTSLRWKEENIALFDSLTSVFEATYPNLKVSKKLREKINRLQQTAVGGKVPEIKMNTLSGATVNLFSVTKKYTLIDFWASWCGPCRRESEILNVLYKKYNTEGFEIYGISLDTSEKQWKKAMEKDQRTWTNVSSLEGFETPAAYDYSVTALPTNYLIDDKGIIVAKNLHADELEQLVDKVMKN